MKAANAPSDKGRRGRTPGETLHRAFEEFLTVPSLIIAGFLLLAAGTSFLDAASVPTLEPLRALLRERVFQDGKATGALLGVIATSLITVTSITFSLLLLAVQQAAAALTSVVYDQFMRRRINQVYFGFFVGLALFSLVILATAGSSRTPVFGAALALLLTIAALYLMILLLYTTIDQMRPAVVIEAIHDHTLLAWERHRELLLRTRRAARGNAAPAFLVHATKDGFVTRVDLGALQAAARKAGGKIEIVLRVSLGSFVAFQDALAEIHGLPPAENPEAAAEAVRRAIHLEEQRDLDHDPAYGIEQMATIGWTSISTAMSNPSPGILAVHNLRDLLARWSAEAADEPAPEATAEAAPVVYADDVPGQLFDAFESLAVAASESMQHQTLAEIVGVFAVMLERLPGEQQGRVEDVVARLLAGLGDHVLTAKLDAAFSRLIGAFERLGRGDTAARITIARDALAASIGKLGSRASRVPNHC